MFQYKQYINFVYFLFPFEHEMFHRILMTYNRHDLYLCDEECSRNFHLSGRGPKNISNALADTKSIGEVLVQMINILS